MSIGSDYIKKEYDKLLVRDDISRELIEHPKFYEIFSDILSSYEQLGKNIEVKYDSDKNIISFSHIYNYPDATNGVYKGVKGCELITLGIEKDGDELFLCKRSNNGNTFMNVPGYVNEGKNFYTYSRDLEVYDEKTHIGRINFTGNCKIENNSNATLWMPNTVPDLKIRDAVSSTIPRITDPGISSTFYIKSSGRRSVNSPGIVTACEEMYKEGKCARNSYYLAIDLERPETLYNMTTIASLEEGNKEWKFSEEFASLEEAVEYYSDIYKERISGVNHQL